MKHLTDEEIQALLENGNIPESSQPADVEAYRLLFESLSALPPAEVPASFADQVTAEARQYTFRKKGQWQAAFVFLLVLFICIGSLVALLLAYKNEFQHFFSGITPYVPVFAAMAVITVVFYYADHKWFLRRYITNHYS